MSPLSLFHPQDTGNTAVFSPCRTYRYALERRWASGPFVLFVGLNPSTADENTDDPTIRRCIGFAKDWGCGGLLMGNLFAFRSTDPKGLPHWTEAVGPDNDVWLSTMAKRSRLTVAAWGSNAAVTDRRVADVLELFAGEVSALGVTQSGAPRHPLYMPKSATPSPWPPSDPQGSTLLHLGPGRLQTADLEEER